MILKTKNIWKTKNKISKMKNIIYIDENIDNYRDERILMMIKMKE